MRHFRAATEYEKDFEAIMDKLCYTRQRWEAWEGLIEAIACSISNSTERNSERRERREKQFSSAIARIGGAELAAKAMGCIVGALEDNPDQDFLGDMYMRMELGNHYHGQFFTPYNLCEMTSMSLLKDAGDMLERNGWLSVCDPAIGGGAMLIAAANNLKRMGINYQESVIFVGQDIDRIVGMMAYIQLSLLGCPGYICIADTLRNPLTGPLLSPEDRPDQEFWYMPFFFTDVWEIRRRLKVMDAIFAMAPRRIEKIQVPPAKKEAETMEEPKKPKVKLKRSGMEGQVSIFDLMGGE